MESKKPNGLTFAVAALLVLGITLNIVAFGPLESVLQMRFGKSDVVVNTGEDISSIQEEGRKIALDIEREGLILLENNGTLPYESTGKAVDILGYFAVNPYYGGSGSGAYSDTTPPTDYKAAFTNAGWTVNEALWSAYEVEANSTGLDASFPLPDPEPSQFWDKTDSNADLAVVVLGRAGGENADLPTTGYGTSGTDHYLTLTVNERALLKRAAETYQNVVVILNTANSMELGPVEELYSGAAGSKGNIDAVIWVGKPGYYGLNALVEVIEGKVNPSGRLTDTFAYNVFSAPAARSLGNNVYLNLPVDGSMGNGTEKNAHYQQYNEGIYVGYRYYETAAALGHISYENTVQYPFGYGLSYTDFSWEIERADIPAKLNGESEIRVTVKVTNNGRRAGKDVVELYAILDETQLKEMKLPHSAVSLVAFAKTAEIPAGKSGTVELTFRLEDMASFDDIAAYSADGSYVIEAGSYTLALRTDSHTDKGNGLSIQMDLENAIVYNSSSTDSGADTSVSKRPSDLVTVRNVFGAYDDSTVNGNHYGLAVNYLTPSSPAEDWQGGVAHKGDEDAPASLVDFIANGNNVSITNKGYPVHDEAVTVEAGITLSINDYGAVDYDDESWISLVQQMTVGEMNKLITMGGYKTEAVESIGKLKTVESDGGSSLAYFSNPSQYPGVAHPCPIVLASTWNVELAEQFGESVAKECVNYGIAGWYAPGANIHRMAFSGRAFEYYSEDPTVTAYMAMHVSSAATKAGVITYVKHFALNDTETNRNNSSCHWVTEQALREIYLKAYEFAVKAQDKFSLVSTTGIMSGFDYIGDRWAGASYELLTIILRDEWGFKGSVITDYFGGYGYMNYDCAIRAGNDLMLNTLSTTGKLSKSSNDDRYYMQKAVKNILYSYSRTSYVSSGAESAGGLAPWQIFAIVANVIWWAVTIALAGLCIRKWVKTKQSANSQTNENLDEDGVFMKSKQVLILCGIFAVAIVTAVLGTVLILTPAASVPANDPPAQVTNSANSANGNTGNAAPVAEKDATVSAVYTSKINDVSYDVDGTEYTFHPRWTLTTYTDDTYMLVYSCEMTFGMSAGVETRTSFGTLTKELTDPDESDVQYTYSLAKPDRIMLNDGYAWGTFEHLDTEGNDYDSVVAAINGNANATWFWWTAEDTVKAYIDESTHEIIGIMGDNSLMNTES